METLFPVVWEKPEDAQAMWLFDLIHCPAPISRLDGELRLFPLVEGISRGWQAYGLPVTMEPKLINGYLYHKITVPPLAPETIPDLMHATDARVRSTYSELAMHWESSWLPEIQSHMAELTAFAVDTASLPALHAHLSAMQRRITRLWELHHLLLLPTLLAISDFEEAYQVLFPEAKPLDVFDLLAGFSNKTVETNLRLWELGREVAGTAALRTVFTETAIADLPAALQTTPEGRALWNRITQFLHVYGERNDDLFIGKPTWLEDPAPMLRGLREAVLKPERDLAAELARQAEQREVRLAQVRALLASHPQVVQSEFATLLKAAQLANVISEDHHFWLDCKVTYHARRVSMAVGKRLAEQGVLDSAEDVFQLSLAELASLGDAPVDDASATRSTVAARKAEAARFAGVMPPPLLGVPIMFLDCAALRTIYKVNGSPMGPPSGEGSNLQGLPGSRGKTTGPVRVARTLEEAEQLRAGEILVAPFTLPSWTIYFATAAAIVTDIGGILCHAAVVAREYGIPSVVGTQRATQTFRNGQLIEVDGDTGRVSLVEPGSSGVDHSSVG